MRLIAEFLICLCAAYLGMILFRVCRCIINASRFMFAMPRCVDRTITFIGDFLDDLMNTTVYPEYDIDQFIEFIISDKDKIEPPPIEVCRLATWILVENDYEQEKILTSWVDNIGDWIFHELYQDLLNEVFDLSTGCIRFKDPYRYMATRLLSDKKDRYLAYIQKEYAYLILYLRYAHAEGEDLKKIRKVNMTKYDSCHRTILDEKQTFVPKYKKMMNDQYERFIPSFYQHLFTFE